MNSHLKVDENVLSYIQSTPTRAIIFTMCNCINFRYWKIISRHFHSLADTMVFGKKLNNIIWKTKWYAWTFRGIIDKKTFYLQYWEIKNWDQNSVNMRFWWHKYWSRSVSFYFTFHFKTVKCGSNFYFDFYWWWLLWLS